jgi:NAD(P)-dependent dehydrogenase (short-subunit alcohol dehydrogenase family)
MIHIMNDSYRELCGRVAWVTGSSRGIGAAVVRELAAAGANPGMPEDVARAVRFLVSDDTSWITGITLDVAGGATMVR